MSQFQSFFITATGDSNQCEELNAFLKSHIIIRTVENMISTGQNCGIQVLVEYRNVGESTSKQTKKIDWRASLKTEKEKEIFDKLKAFRANLSKQKKLPAAYMICKDEHLVKIIQNPSITVEEIINFPNSSNIMLKDFANDLYTEFKKLSSEKLITDDQSKIPF